MIKKMHDLPTFLGKIGIRTKCNLEEKNSNRDGSYRVKLSFIFYFILYIDV